MKLKLMEEHIYVETGWCDAGYPATKAESLIDELEQRRE